MTAWNVKEAEHRSVPFFEDVPCYPIADMVKLHGLRKAMLEEEDEARQQELLKEFTEVMEGLEKVENAPQRVYLWRPGNMPATGTYLDNSDLKYHHDPNFAPYMYELLIPEDQKPKGALILCAGGDHGDCVIHEAYQSALDFNARGYQCFLLLNRPNRMPYTGQECGADVARLVQMIRADAARYRIDENQVAFAGFSNGGLTGEECIRYYSGSRKIKDYFPSYIPDELDERSGCPDAFVCVYGPRWDGVEIDYTDVHYPPVMFAVGMEDTAMDNLHWVYPDLLKHGIRAEVHTFTGVPHGQAGVSVLGNHEYPNFDLWVPLADAFMQKTYEMRAYGK